ARSVPMSSAVVAEKRLPGRRFRGAGGVPVSASADSPLALSYYNPAMVWSTLRAEHAGRYQLVVVLTAKERFGDGVSYYNKCRLIFKVDGQVVHQATYARGGGKPFNYEINQDWQVGPQELTFELQPLTPTEKQVRSLVLRIAAVTVRGPLEK